MKGLERELYLEKMMLKAARSEITRMVDDHISHLATLEEHCEDLIKRNVSLQNQVSRLREGIEQ
jgi:hypothetical protein